MTTRQGGRGLVKTTWLALLILIGLAISGCRSAPAACNGNFKNLMPADWRYINQWALDTDGNKQLDCVVLYRFDTKTQEGQQITPVGGVVFRQDHGRPRWIYPHQLTPPNNFYLGETLVVPWVGDVLSGSPEPELVISDTDKTGAVVQATIFGWRDDQKGQPDTNPNPNVMGYKPLGFFQGDAGVIVEKDRVTVLVRRKDTRSQLADRKVYVPREDKKNYYNADSFDLPAPIETDLISLAMGDDPTISPYPEKTMLAFYQNIKDNARITGLVKTDILTDTLNILQDKTPAYTCSVARDQLDRMLVQDIKILGTEAQPQITVTGKCKLKDGSFKDMTPITWQIEKNAGGKWQLKGATQ
jgi:hypothetical protein